MKSKKQKAAIAAVAIPVITAGTVAIGAAYQNGNRFEPSDTDQQMQKNQIVFSDDQNLGGEDEKKIKITVSLSRKTRIRRIRPERTSRTQRIICFSRGCRMDRIMQAE